MMVMVMPLGRGRPGRPGRPGRALGSSQIGSRKGLLGLNLGQVDAADLNGAGLYG
jgi:hypothetical protein